MGVFSNSSQRRISPFDVIILAYSPSGRFSAAGGVSADASFPLVSLTARSFHPETASATPEPALQAAAAVASRNAEAHRIPRRMLAPRSAIVFPFMVWQDTTAG